MYICLHCGGVGFIVGLGSSNRQSWSFKVGRVALSASFLKFFFFLPNNHSCCGPSHEIVLIPRRPTSVGSIMVTYMCLMVGNPLEQLPEANNYDIVFPPKISVRAIKKIQISEIVTFSV